MTRRRPRSPWPPVLAALLILSACRAPRPERIVLITVDCLRPDFLGCYGTRGETSPEIDRIAGFSVLFNRAYSNAPWTKPAFASLFTALLPHQHLTCDHQDVLPDEAETLAEIFRAAGFHTLFINGANGFLSPDFGFDQGFEDYVETGMDAEEVAGAFLSRLPGLEGKRFFACLHFMDLHIPYNLNPWNRSLTSSRPDLTPGFSGDLTTADLRARTVEKRLPGQDRDYLVALYRRQLRYVDSRIGRIVRALRRSGGSAGTLVIITADHGEEFWDHGQFEHGHTLYDELLHIPMMIYGAGPAPRRIDTPVSLVDLYPTLLERAGLQGPSGPSAGRSLSPLLSGNPTETPRPVFAAGLLYGEEKYSLAEQGLKIILSTGDTRGKHFIPGYAPSPRIQVFDSAADPGEREDLAAVLPGTRLRPLADRLKSFLALEPVLRAERKEIGPRLREKLEALGYIRESPVPRKQKSSETSPESGDQKTPAARR